MNFTRATVRIESVPLGEAPLWVREKWVGLTLPTVLKDDELIQTRTFGVLSAPRSRIAQAWALLCGRAKHVSSYVVPVQPALQALEAASPEAAAWWRQNARHVLRPKACFVFEASCGRICENAL